MNPSGLRFRLLLTVSAIVLAVAGILGWLVAGLTTNGGEMSLAAARLPAWVAVIGIGVVIVTAFFVALSGRRVMLLASELSGEDARNSSYRAVERAESAAGAHRADLPDESGAESRAVFYRQLQSEVARTSRYGHHLSLLVLAIDATAHAAAGEAASGDSDQSLSVTVGQIVRNCIRASDVYGRTGTGGFTILLAETDEAGARRVAEKLRRSIEVYPFDRPQPVTVSIGVAAHRAADNAEALMDRADAACATAAGAGGNRISS